MPAKQRISTSQLWKTFSPGFLPETLRHPLIGYLVAVLLPVCAVVVITFLVHYISTFRFIEAPLILVVLLVALGWGLAPSMLATLVGATFFVLLLLSSYFSATITRGEDALGVIMYILVSLIIGVVSSQTQHARYAAETLSRRLESIVEAIPDPVVIYDRKEGHVQLNQPARERAAVEPQLLSLMDTQLHKELALQTLSGESLHQHDFPLDRALRGEVVRGTELAYRSFDNNQQRFIAVSAAPLYASATEIEGAVIVTHDISSLREAEREASERASQLEAIFEAITDALFIVDMQGNPRRINRAARALLDVPEDVRTGSLFMNGYRVELYDEQNRLLPDEQWPQTRILAGEVLQGLNAPDVTLRTPAGRTLLINVSGSPIYDKNGAISGAVLACRDITQRRQVEQRLLVSEREAEQRARQLEAVFDAMIDGVMVYDATGQVTRMNNAYAKLIGLDAAPEHLQLTPDERGKMLALRDEQDHPLLAGRMPVQRMLAGEVFTAERAMDIRLHSLDGRDVQLNITGTPLYDQWQHLTGGVLIFRDVTERRVLERRTQESLHALLVMAEEIVQLPDVGAQSRLSNDALKRVGQRLAELMCRILNCQRLSLTIMDKQTHTLRSLAVVGLSPEQERRWHERQPLSSLSEVVQGTSVEKEVQINEVSVIDYTRPPLLGRPNPYNVQTMVLAPLKIRTQLIGMLSLDHGSEAHSYTQDELVLIKAVADLAALVLERERLHEERAEAQANALAAQEAARLMEEFLGIAGHELRTPLTTIKASIQLAKRQMNRIMQQETALPPTLSPQMGTVRGFLERSERQVGMLNRLVSDLLDVSRVQTGRLELHPELYDIVALVRDVVDDQHDLTPERTIRFTSSVPADLLVLADADRLRQVINNYLSNALKYSAINKPVEVRIEPVGTQVRVSVQDEGPGLSETQREHIWERFYRVPGIEVKSGSGVGLGLGLHISRMLIERQGGQVGVESVKGQGSTFWFTLPLADR